MQSPKPSSSSSMSPSYKNLKYKHSHSPVELKEKIRKDYRSKIQNCRNLLLNKFRESNIKNELHCTLSDFYKDLFNFTEGVTFNEEENELLEEIKQELIQEEISWLNDEYEKSLGNVDWSLCGEEDHVLCLICLKNNFKLHEKLLTCENCRIEIKTQMKSLEELKNNIFSSMDKHNPECKSQFSLMSEGDQSHIYLICDTCLDMQLIV